MIEPLDCFVVFAVERLGFSREQVLERFNEIYQKFNELYREYEDLYHETLFLQEKCRHLEELLEWEEESKYFRGNDNAEH